MRVAPPFLCSGSVGRLVFSVKENYQARDIYHKHYSHRSIILLQNKACGGVPGHKVRKVEYVRYGFTPRFCLAFWCLCRRLWPCWLLGQKTSEPAGSDAGSAKASSKKAVELQIFAANSLEKALPEVQELYTEQTGTTFADTQFKASGDLVEQMRAGATVDVLITASKGTMDDAEAAGLVDADTREDMFVNDLVIIRAEGSDTKVEVIDDVANLDARSPLATPRPFPPASTPTRPWPPWASTPAPRATTASMLPRSPTRSRWPTKLVPPPPMCPQATAWPVLSTALTSSATTASRRPSCAPRIRTSHRVSGAVADGSEHADEAKAFIDFCLTNKKAQKIWAKYGFELSA